MTNTLKVAAYRNAIDHLFRIANVDYQACVGVREVECWKETAARVLAQTEGLQCLRANAYDREQFTKAVEAVKAQLIAANARIAQLATKSVLNSAQRAAAEQMRRERPPVIEGTNTIIDDEARLRWYNKVVDEMTARNVVGHQMVAEFCDISGAPD